MLSMIKVISLVSPCSVHVNVDGNIFPCMSISMEKKTRLEDILRGEMFTKFKTHQERGKCVSL